MASLQEKINTTDDPEISGTCMIDKMLFVCFSNT
jgi:hypothetical protein